MTKPLSALVLVAVAIAGVLGGWALNSYMEEPKPVPIVRTEEPPSDKLMEREFIRFDIQETGKDIGLSERQQRDYLLYLESASNKYNLPMLLVHTIAYVESNYDPSAVHPPITVKGKKTRAIGLMGVVWEYHSEALIRDSIATARLDLMEPRVNLLAGAFILHTYIEDIIAKNPNIKEDRFFDELIKRYYGAYDEAYKNRMLDKMRDIASKQWIRKTVKSILDSRK